MGKKKKRTKNKKKSGGETKARRAEKAEQKKSVEAAEAKASEVEDDEDEEEEVEEAEEKAEAKAEEKPKKAKKNKEAAKKTAAMLGEATAHFSEGRYRDAREKLVALLDSNPSPEEREQAQELLGNMEMDVRTLMVGAVAMVTLLLIPALGYTNFAKALWTIPVLFLLLIVDPRLFRSPGSTATEEK